jgi:hypothetical protein
MQAIDSVHADPTRSGRAASSTLARIQEQILRRRAMFYDGSIASAPFSR